MYGQNAIAVNEFLGKSWRHVNHPFMKFDEIKTKLKQKIGKNILIHK